jgi:hypothetical protein
MPALRRWVGISLVALFALGCGRSGFINAKGRIMKGGQPFLTEPGEGFRISFVPMEPLDDSHYDSYAAVYDPADGSFRVVGKDGQGLPRGNYRIGLQLMKQKEDLLGNQLTANKSPFTCEVVSSSSEVVIDLDKADFDAIRAAVEKKAKKPTRRS